MKSEVIEVPVEFNSVSDLKYTLCIKPGQPFTLKIKGSGYVGTFIYTFKEIDCMMANYNWNIDIKNCKNEILTNPKYKKYLIFA